MICTTPDEVVHGVALDPLAKHWVGIISDLVQLLHNDQILLFQFQNHDF